MYLIKEQIRITPHTANAFRHVIYTTIKSENVTRFLKQNKNCTFALFVHVHVVSLFIQLQDNYLIGNMEQGNIRNSSISPYFLKEYLRMHVFLH